MKWFEVPVLAVLPVLLAASSVFLAACSGSEEIEYEGPPVRPSPAFELTNLEALNTSSDEFAPHLLPGGNALLYTSNRPDEQDRERLDDVSKYGEAAYKATRRGMDWLRDGWLYDVGVLKHNHGAAVVNESDGQIFLGVSYLKDSPGGTDICAAAADSSVWSAPTAVPELSSAWWDSHPAISDDGRMIVFASDRREDLPEASTAVRYSPDLWFSEHTDSGWTAPEKLPEPVNSEAEEISPFFGGDGYLYFASKRDADAGFDIFRSKKTEAGWDEPERLPGPLNSRSDDVFPCLSEDRLYMFLASDRPGGAGGLDLYRTAFPHNIELEVKVLLREEEGVVLPASGVYAIVRKLLNDKPVRSSYEGRKPRLASRHTDMSGTVYNRLEASSRYLIQVGSPDCYSGLPPDTLVVGIPFALDTTIIRTYILERPVFPVFQLGRFNIPFFVTGYYHPNTSTNYRTLKRRILEGELDLSDSRGTPYIDPDDEDYNAYVTGIDAIFDSVYATIEQKYLPAFGECSLGEDRLEIEVRGFVDPRGLATGRYVDSTVSTRDVTIQQGEIMSGQEGNRKLATLRAYYTLEMIDRKLQKRSERYRRLKKNGRIVLRAVGVGIDTETIGSELKDPAKRRIDIKCTIVGND